MDDGMAVPASDPSSPTAPAAAVPGADGSVPRVEATAAGSDEATDETGSPGRDPYGRASAGPIVVAGTGPFPGSAPALSACPATAPISAGVEDGGPELVDAGLASAVALAAAS